MTSREQFEAWAKDQGYINLSRGNDGQYKYQTAWAAWAGWQSSRAAVVVQLPETEYFGDSWSGGWAITRENVTDALEEQGLKVAP